MPIWQKCPAQVTEQGNKVPLLRRGDLGESCARLCSEKAQGLGKNHLEPSPLLQTFLAQTTLAGPQVAPVIVRGARVLQETHTSRRCRAPRKGNLSHSCREGSSHPTPPPPRASLEPRDGLKPRVHLLTPPAACTGPVALFWVLVCERQ